MLAIFLDIETTGLNPYHHSPVEIAIKIVNLSTRQYLDEYHSIIKYPVEIWEKRDPESIEVNGFTLEKMNEGEILELVRDAIIQLFERNGIQRGEAVFICQNPSFDRAFFNQLVDVYTQEKLNWPYHWLDLASMYWSSIATGKQSAPKMISLSKNAIATAYNLPTEQRPHMAMNGVDHLIQCYQAVLDVEFTMSKQKG